LSSQATQPAGFRLEGNPAILLRRPGRVNWRCRSARRLRRAVEL